MQAVHKLMKTNNTLIRNQELQFNYHLHKTSRLSTQVDHNLVHLKVQLKFLLTA